MKVFITDCEGPITKNDNAMELCGRFIPEGERFFAVVSRYDDYLAYGERRPGYKAGDTLKLVLPFLLAFGATVEEMLSFSLRTLVTMPRALEALRRIGSLLPTFIVSTSYEPYLKALCGLVPFPMENVYCTSVGLEGLAMPEQERRRLQELAREVASAPLLEWEGEEGRARLKPDHEEAFRRLDEIFWQELRGAARQLIQRVDPVGGEVKARAVEEIVRKVGAGLDEALYVGDSITDREALRLVREGGGVAVAFNANRYALEVAEVACLSKDASPLVVLALLFVQGGREEVLRGVLNWRAEYLRLRGIPEEWIGQAELGLLNRQNLPLWTERSEAFRKEVRGVKVGGLG